MAMLIPVMWLVMGMTVPLSGTVVDADGHPVAGATVWLGDTFATRKGPEVLATAETDDRGRFRLDRADDLAGRGGMWSPTLWAYKPGSRVAFLEFKGNIAGADEPVRLVLGPPASTSLRVLQPDGKPARGRERPDGPGERSRPPPAGQAARPPRRDDRRRRPRDARRLRARGHPRRRRDARRASSSSAWRSTPTATAPPSPPARPARGPDRRRRPEGPPRLDDHGPGAADRAGLPRALHDPLGSARPPATTAASSSRARRGTGPLGASSPRGLELSRGASPRRRRSAPARSAAEIKSVRASGSRGSSARNPEGTPIPGIKVDIAPLRHGLPDRRMVGHRCPGAVLEPSSCRARPDLASRSRHAEGLLPAAERPHWADFEVKEGEERQNSTRPGSGGRRGPGEGGGRGGEACRVGVASTGPGPRPIRAESEHGPGPVRRPGRVRPGPHRPEGRGQVSRRRGDRPPTSDPSPSPRPARVSRSRSASGSGRPWPSPAGCSAATAGRWPAPSVRV